MHITARRFPPGYALLKKQWNVSNRWGKETMNRLASITATILTVTVIGSSGAALAFSLHWGQGQSIDAYGTGQTTRKIGGSDALPFTACLRRSLPVGM